MPAFAYAERLVLRAIQILSPFCERIEVVGAMRRERNEVEAIELLLIPKTVTVKVDLFTTREDLQPGLLKLLNYNPNFIYVKGDPSKKTHREAGPINRKLTDGTEVKFHFATVETWGSMMACKTGPFTLLQLIGQKCSRKRWELKGGRVLVKKTKVLVSFPEEQLFFEALKIPYLDPKDRWQLKPTDLSWTQKKP